MVQVVAAILEMGGKILIGQRKPEQAHPLQWEFPGGKVEAEETPPEALARELGEELGITGISSEEITRYHYAYPGKSSIELIFFRVTSYEGEARNRIFHDLRWEEVRRLHGYDFLEGDRDFLRMLAG